jgi:transcriptional regulator with XRE-family HTH domain
MTFPPNANERSSKGDHNRRLSLGIGSHEFAAAAGVTPDELHAYEFTGVDGSYDVAIAERIGQALERLEGTIEPKIDNGSVPESNGHAERISNALRADTFADELAFADMDFAEQLISSKLSEVDPSIQLVSTGERARGQIRELLVRWRDGSDGEEHQEVIAIPPRTSPS